MSLTVPRPAPGRSIEATGVFERDGNAFGAMRLLFAAMVIVSHSWVIGGFGDEPLSGKGPVSLGFVAVLCFFALSGLLVGLSAERLPTGRYLWHRVRRIYPGYWASLLVTALVIAPLIVLVRDLPWDALSHPNSARSFIANNITLHVFQFNIGSILDGLPYPTAINASIWTLAYEFTCYLLVYLAIRLWIASGRDSRALLLMTGASVVLACTVWNIRGLVLLRVPILGPLDLEIFASLWSVFMIGTCLAVWRDRIPLTKVLTGVAIGVLVVSVPLGLFRPGCVLLLPYAVLGAGYYAPTSLRGIGARNDISYGVYLYGFPAGQLLIAMGPDWWNPATLIVATLALSAALATASWFLVERPFLQRRAAVPEHGPGDAA